MSNLENKVESLLVGKPDSRESFRPPQSSSSSSVKHKSSHKRSSSKDRPSPLDFEIFLPWVCKQWHCLKPVVVRRLIKGKIDVFRSNSKTNLETYVNIEDRKSSSKSTKKSSRKRHDLDTGVRISDASKTSQITSHSKTSHVVEDVFTKNEKENNVIVTAYYDSKKHLIKVAFPVASEVSKKVIQALSLCLPYQPLLTSLNFHNGLSSQQLYEISKLLPHSNLTEIRLYDCFIPEGNYYLLLEQISELKVLSLNRCSINDLVCKELVSRLEVGSSGSLLLSLDLASNCITDIGAKYIAQVLRLNRTLLHLNLSGNRLTDKGAKIILTQLAEFPLTATEVLDRRHRKMKYLESKVAVYQRCLEELRQKYVNSGLKSSASTKTMRSNKSFIRQKCSIRSIKGKKGIKSSASNKSLTSKQSFSRKGSRKSLLSTVDIAENTALNIVGEFVDPFELTGIIYKNSYRYYIGNLVLCSLNLDYNNLSYFTIKKICEVLKYQQKIRQCFGKTGLLRIVFEGNPIPQACAEYGEIKDLLMEAILDRVPPSLSKKKINSPILDRKKINSI